MSKWPHVQYTDLLQRLFPLALFWQTQCNIGKKEDKLEFFMRQNYIAAVHASRAGLSDLVGPSTIAYFDLTLAFETVPFVHTLFFLHCKYFHYHKYNFSLCSNFQCTLLKCGFCKKLLLYEFNSDQLPTFFHFVITFGWVQQQSNSKPTQKWWQNEKKVGNWSELHS